MTTPTLAPFDPLAEAIAAVDGLPEVTETPLAGPAGDGQVKTKDLGGVVDIQACSLSMDLLHLESGDLDPLVDGVEGVTAFYLNAGEGQLVFI